MKNIIFITVLLFISFGVMGQRQKRKVSQTSCPTYQKWFSDIVEYKQNPNASKKSLLKKYQEFGLVAKGKGGRVKNDRGRSMKAQKKFRSKVKRNRKNYSKSNRKATLFAGRLFPKERPKPYHWNGQDH